MDSSTEFVVDSDEDSGDRLWVKADGEMKNQGFRDGLSQGEEASLQAGFNSGYAAAVVLGRTLGTIRGSLRACIFLADAELEGMDLADGDREKINRLLTSTSELETELPEAIKRMLGYLSSGEGAHRNFQKEFQILCTKLEHFGLMLGIHLPDENRQVQSEERPSQQLAVEEVDPSGLGCQQNAGSCCHAEEHGQKQEGCRNLPAALTDKSPSSWEEAEVVLSVISAQLTKLATALVQALDVDVKELLKHL